MPPVPSVFADYTAHMQQTATVAPSLWRSIALSLAAVICLLLYLRRRRQPQAAPYRNEQSARAFEKCGSFTHPDPAPPPPYFKAITTHLSTPNYCCPSSFSTSAAAPPPLPLPTLRRHSSYVAQQARSPTITHYERRTSLNGIGPPRSIRGSIMKGGPLGLGVRRNHWTIEIR